MMLVGGRPDRMVGWIVVCRGLGLLATEIGRVHSLDIRRELR